MRERACLIMVGMATDLCSEIRGTTTSIRHGEATYIGNPVTGRRIYTPPTGKQIIEDKLRNWEHFINTDTELDPLVQMADDHYQFEALHPYEDRKGLTCWIINALML